MNPAAPGHDPGGKVRRPWPADPVGPENDRNILEMAAQARTVVLAFGQPPKALCRRGQEVAALLSRRAALCHLRLAKDGTPVHPLYLPAALVPQPHRKGSFGRLPIRLYSII